MVKSSMNGIKRNDVADGRVGSEGGRRPSALSTGHNGVASGPLAPGQRWSVARLGRALERIAEAEFRMKLTGLPAQTICREAMFALAREARAGRR